MLRTRHLVGFCGHRSRFSEAAVRPALTTALKELQQRSAEAGGGIELYVSAAEGTDVVCIEAARELGIPVHVLLPLAEGEFEKDFSSPATWARSKAQMDRAAAVPGPDSLRTVEGESTRPECYFNQGIAMLEAVDVLIAVWDGQPPRGSGGTAQMIAQARAMGLPVLHIQPADGMAVKDAGFDEAIGRDAILDELNGIANAAGGGGMQEAGTPDDLQQRLDEIAMNEAEKLRPSLVRIILIHGVAAVLAALVTFKMMDKQALWEKYKWVVSLTELALVCVALWMNFLLRHRQVRDRWLRCRFACELVRGLRASVPIMDPLHPAISWLDGEWHRFALSAGLLVQSRHTHPSVVAQRDHYLSTRLSDEHPDGQIRHYTAMNPATVRWWSFTGWLGDWCTRLAPPFVLASVLNKLSKIWRAPDGWGLENGFSTWLAVGFLPIALPLMAGVFTSLRHALDAGRRKERYPQMVQSLRELRASLQGLETESTIRHTVARCESILLDELREWRAAASSSKR
ncbi:hypothetical protein [Prosthecobacter sp.]|uniref:hypothetical protein n=1 Tax=Prosthecobacter sp. TaxID=1965333 RepID=UPI003784411A